MYLQAGSILQKIDYQLFKMKPQKIVIAIDSFKGCLTSAEAGEAAAQGVHAACPECQTIVLPVADGGEGMLDVLLAASNGKRITVRAHDPLMQPCDASYGISGDGNTAFVEMAAISGLPLVPADKRNPMKTTTFGTGELIHDALERGCLRFVIGLGGSATNDAGLGMLQALGFRFFDKEGHEVGSMEKGIALCGALLSEISSIDSSSAHPALKKACFTTACDVRNPFFGPNGAAHVFAPGYGEGTGYCHAASFRRHIPHYRQRRILASRCRCGRRYGGRSPRISGCTVETRHRASFGNSGLCRKD